MLTVKAKSSLADRLRGRLKARTATVGVIGLGYVGLPLARAFAASGFPVLGFDIDADKVERLSRGESYIGHIPADARRARCASRRFEATDRLRPARRGRRDHHLRADAADRAPASPT